MIQKNRIQTLEDFLMMNKKQMVKAIALTVLCTIAFPVQAFNLRDLWNSFKQNPQAQIVAGFSMAATVASIGYLVYKYRFKTPATPPAHSAAYQSALSGAAPIHAPSNLDLKHTAARQQEEQAQMDTLGRMVRQSKPKTPSTPQQKPEHNKLYNVTKTQPLDHSAGNASSGSLGVSIKLGAQTFVKPRSQDQGGNVKICLKIEADNIARIAIRIGQNELSNEAKLKAQRAAQLEQIAKTTLMPLASENNAASTLVALTQAQADVRKQQDEESEKAILMMDAMRSKLTRTVRALAREDITAEGIEQQIAILDEIRENLFSFNVIGDNCAQRFADNFKNTNIKSKKAYSALRIYGIIPSSETTIKFSEIKTSIEKTIQAEQIKKERDEQKLLNLRQLLYVFRNHIIAAQYDAYVNNRPILSITPEMRADFATLIQEIKSDALRIQGKLKLNALNGNWVESYEIVEVLGIKNPAASTSTRRIDLGKAPLSIDGATSLVNPEQPTQSSTTVSVFNAIRSKISPTHATPKAPADPDQKDVKSQSDPASSTATDLMSQAGNAARKAGSAFASAVNSTAAVASAASAALIARVSPTIPESTTVIPNRPAPVIIDHSQAPIAEPQADVPAMAPIEPAQSVDPDAMKVSPKAPLNLDNSTSIA